MGDKFVVEWGEVQAIAPATLQRESMAVTTGTGEEGTNFPASIVFDRALVALGGPDAPLYGVWAGALRLPLNLPTNPRAVWFKTDVRISAELGAGARALIVIAVEGETYVRELTGEGGSRPQDYSQQQAGPEATRRDDTLEFVHKARALPARQYTASVFLTAERPSQTANVRVSIDSLEVTVNPDFQP